MLTQTEIQALNAVLASLIAHSSEYHPLRRTLDFVANSYSSHAPEGHVFHSAFMAITACMAAHNVFRFESTRVVIESLIVSAGDNGLQITARISGCEHVSPVVHAIKFEHPVPLSVPVFEFPTSIEGRWVRLLEAAESLEPVLGSFHAAADALLALASRPQGLRWLELVYEQTWVLRSYPNDARALKNARYINVMIAESDLNELRSKSKAAAEQPSGKATPEAAVQGAAGDLLSMPASEIFRLAHKQELIRDNGSLESALATARQNKWMLPILA